MRNSSISPFPPAPESSELDVLLALFRAGEHGAVCAGVSQLARQAEAAGQWRLAAHALHLLGQSQTLNAQLRLAYAAYARAAHLAREGEDLLMETQALAMVSYASGILGHVDEALEAGQFAVRLADQTGNATLRVTARNSLGIAMFWNGSFDEADTGLGQAYLLARSERVAPEALVRPAINRCANEVYRQFHRRQALGVPVEPARLTELLSDLHGQMAAEWRPRSRELQNVLQLLVAWMNATAAAWRGDGAAARAYAHLGAQFLAQLPTVQWLAAMLDWVAVECELAEQRLDDALASARRLVARAGGLQHEQMALIGHHCVAEVLHRQGQATGALEELRRLRQREARIRAESLAHREQVAQWRFELRQRSQELQHLVARARVLQRQSQEDPLTGLANRRQLNEQLELLLSRQAESGEGFSLVMLDVDRFKDINDHHSHGVGDEVLCRIARILMAHVRVRDLPARLAGDEFVVLLHEPADADGTRQRLRTAVANHDWDDVAPGLRVSVSLGITRSEPGDTWASLMARSDALMYRDKRRCLEQV